MNSTPANSDYITKSRFAYLENVLQIPIFENQSEPSALTRIDDILMEQAKSEVGLLFVMPSSNNILVRALLFVKTILKIRKFKQSITKALFSLECSYAVYPTIESPLVVYSLASNAEQYTNNNILPKLGSGLIGSLRSIMMKVGHCHPSVAGIILVIKAK